MEQIPVNSIENNSNTIRVNDTNTPIKLIFKYVDGSIINLKDKIDYFYLTKDSEKFYSVTDITFEGDELIFKLPNLIKGLYRIEIKDIDGSIYPADDSLFILLKRSFEEGKESYYTSYREDILNNVDPIIIQHIEENPDKFKGERGQQGFPGRDGLRGKDGLKGDKGDKGDQGIQGIQGIKGDKGDKGDPGKDGELSKENLDAEVIKIKDLISNYGLNVKDFGALGDGVTDDTLSIQQAIDKANEINIRKVIIPPGVYLVSESIILNGCNVEGIKSNVFGDNQGVIIEAITKDFSIITQGSHKGNDLEYSVKNITALNGLVGFELTYVLNSEFNNLHAINCQTGYLLGKPTAVGSMFNIFNNLYTKNCVVGIDIDSKEYFNNNIFNNGFIQGDDYALKMKVTGGYGAVNNSFNNVEFRSNLGRGCLLTSTRNTNFNYCYFEVGGNSIRYDNFNTCHMNQCIYGMFKSSNNNNDNEIIKIPNAGNIFINGGTIFVTSQLTDKFFLDTDNDNVFRNVRSQYTPLKQGSTLATNFNFYRLETN